MQVETFSAMRTLVFPSPAFCLGQSLIANGHVGHGTRLGCSDMGKRQDRLDVGSTNGEGVSDGVPWEGGAACGENGNVRWG